MVDLMNMIYEVPTVMCQTFNRMNKLFHTKPKKQFANVDAFIPSRPYERTNFVNQQGVVAEASFEPMDNEYTGIFSSGAAHVILRLSDYNLQLEDDSGNPTKDSLNPSIQVKFLRDEKPSANFHGMVSFEQKGGQFFANDFMNHIPDYTENEICLPQTIGLFNARATPFIFQNGLLGLAKFDEKGAEVEAD